MRSSAVLLLMFTALIGYFAIQSAARSEQGIALPSEFVAEENVGKPWPCCDDCGVCNRMNPPSCKCNDLTPFKCHPSCQKCIQSPLKIWPPLFFCDDMIFKVCERKCTAESV